MEDITPRATSIPRWMRERIADITHGGDGRFRVEFRAGVDRKVAHLLQTLFRSEHFLKPRSQWWDRPLTMIAYYWIGLLVIGSLVALVWGTLYYVLLAIFGAVAAEEAVSLMALGLTVGVGFIGGIYRHVFDRHPPEMNQHQILEVSPEKIRYTSSACSGPFRGILDSRPEETGEFAATDIEDVSVLEIDHPGPAAFRKTAVLAVSTGSETAYFGHGVDIGELNRISAQIQENLDG